MHHKGEPLREALLDAGIMRLRPVLITVGAPVFGLVPPAKHGGPLWEPLCYTQIGGLVLATFITLILVPVIYAILARPGTCCHKPKRFNDGKSRESVSDGRRGGYFLQ